MDLKASHSRQAMLSLWVIPPAWRCVHRAISLRDVVLVSRPLALAVPAPALAF
jgi:hypothetical protein